MAQHSKKSGQCYRTNYSYPGPIVARVDKNLGNTYVKTMRLEELVRNVATETQDMKNERQTAVNKILRQQSATEDTLKT